MYSYMNQQRQELPKSHFLKTSLGSLVYVQTAVESITGFSFSAKYTVSMRYLTRQCQIPEIP